MLKNMSGGYFNRKKVFPDNRGVFAPLSLKVGGLDWIQSNISFNPNKFTLRGLHFQVGEFAQTKLIKVINGEILDFIVDIREGSENYMMLYMYHMESGDELLVPKGFAHGFITLRDNTIVQYLVDNDYSPESEGSIVWTNFEQIKVKIENLVGNFDENDITISDKDLITKNFKL
jgi:dTDP-4-dehydrorhamnose 3,5-epimerase